TTFVAPLSPERRISSSLSILSEITLDAGATWLSADSAINLVQTPEPSSIGLAGVCLVGAVGLTRGRRREPGRCPKAV
ncbi:MAG TPA: PEP-CTERM sorting domain-containing protein, partial [Lacipirellula sp.]